MILLFLILLQWGPDFRLTDRSAIDRTSRNACKNIVADRQGNIHVVWEAAVPRWRLYYRKFDGTIWLPETLLVTGVEVIRSQFPTIWPDTGGNLHLTFEDVRTIGSWQCVRIFYKKYERSGWRPDTALTDSWDFLRPSLAVDTSNQLHLAMMQFGYPGKILYKRYNGTFWEKETTLARIKSSSGQEFTRPVIQTGPGGRLHIVWADDTTGNFELYYKRYNGSFWEPETMLTNCFESSVYPTVAVDSRSRIHLVWQDFRYGTWDLFYKRFNGISWEPETLLVSVDYIKEHPYLAVDKQDRLHLVWADYRHGTSEIYYKLYDGTAWGPDTRVTNAPGHSYEPFVCTDDSSIPHILWTDVRDGNEEIYYKRGATTDVEEPIAVKCLHRSKLSLSPNPAADFVRIAFDNLTDTESRVAIYNINGRKVLDEVVILGCRRSATVNLRHLPAGVYFLSAGVGDYHLTKKLIIRR